VLCQQLARGDPQTLAVGDFNHDGKLDLVVANVSDSTVSVLQGNGDGTFQNAVSYATGSSPESVTVGVFTGDGNLDIVTAGFAGLSFLKSDGDGTFQKAKNFSLPHEPDFTEHPGPQIAESLAVGDFNGDGTLDLGVGALVTDQHDSNSQGYVNVLLGKGDGTFKVSSVVAVPSLPRVAVGDFNGDGKLDVVAASFGNFVNGLPQGAVNVLLGNGDGTLQAPTTVASDTGTVGVAVGDFNNDGKPDLAVSNSVNTSRPRVSRAERQPEGWRSIPSVVRVQRRPELNKDNRDKGQAIPWQEGWIVGCGRQSV
jgi:hypothetical protein